MRKLRIWQSLIGSVVATFTAATSLLANPYILSIPEAMRQSALLFDYGQRTGDAVLMAAAAKLRAETLGFPLAIEPTDAAPSALTVASMLESARAVADGDPLALSLIDRVEQIRRRGRKEGPLVRAYSFAEDRAATRVPMTFRGAESAIIYAENKAQCPIEIRIIAGDDEELCRDGRADGRALCRWRPAADQEVTLEVHGPEPCSEGFLLINN